MLTSGHSSLLRYVCALFFRLWTHFCSQDIQMKILSLGFLLFFFLCIVFSVAGESYWRPAERSRSCKFDAREQKTSSWVSTWLPASLCRFHHLNNHFFFLQIKRVYFLNILKVLSCLFHLVSCLEYEKRNEELNLKVWKLHWIITLIEYLVFVLASLIFFLLFSTVWKNAKLEN